MEHQIKKTHSMAANETKERPREGGTAGSAAKEPPKKGGTAASATKEPPEKGEKAAGQGARYALTLAEERALIGRAQAGDRAALARLMAAYRPLVLAAAHRRAAKPLGDDAEQAAAEELVRTIYAYDLKKPFPFASYAKVRVHGAISHLLTKTIRGWQRECTTEEADDLERMAGPDPVDPYAAAEARAVLAPLLAKLTAEEREALRLLYARGLTTRAAARAMGCSQSKVYGLKKAALAKMKAAASAAEKEGGNKKIPPDGGK